MVELSERADHGAAAPALSVIIPACDEEDHIVRCLDSLLAQQDVEAGAMEVIVAANNCADATAPRARAVEPRFAERGWRLQVLDIPEGGKPGALNRGDAAARGASRGYLDADIALDPQVIAQTLATLARPEAVYATARLRIAPARSWTTRRYGALYARVPFMRPGSAPGAGWFAVNAAGRARWGLFPDIISDDTYVRWHFAPHERIEVEAGYSWPLVEGFAGLVRVRRRQDAGGRQLRALHPGLEVNEGKPTLGALEHVRLLLGDPVGYAVYAAVQLAVRLGDRDGAQWSRGAR